MILRRLHVVLFVLVGLFTFNIAVESPRLPQIAQTELVIGQKEQAEALEYSGSLPEFFVFNERLPHSPYHVRYEFYLIESQHHHSSL